MKKILSVNVGSRGFREGYEKASEELQIPTEYIRSRHCCFVLRNGNVTLLCKNREVIPDAYALLFIRVAGRYALMTSLIAQFFDHHSISLSDRVYLEHTANQQKITQMLRATLAGIKIPNTVLFTRRGYEDSKEMIQSHISFPCVLKTNGSRGKNVWKIENEKALSEKIKSLDSNVEVVLIQEYIQNEFDIRVLCAHGEILGAIKRTSVDGFLNNVSQGGFATSIDLTDAEKKVTKDACAVFGMTFAGVDLIRTDGVPYLLEVNNGPQIYGFESATHIDVPRELLLKMREIFLNNQP